MGMAYQAACGFFVYYFDKRYALASLLTGALSGLALFILPPFIETLNYTYGLSGALKISSALMLNICVCGSLMRHPKWKVHRQTSQNDKQIMNRGEKLNNVYDEADFVKSQITREDNPRLLMTILRDISKSFDLSLFRNVRFLFQGVLTPFMYGGATVVLVYMVPYGVEAGVSPLKSSFLISVVGICLILTRISPIGWMVDKKIISKSLLGGIPTIFGGITIMAFPFTTTYFQMVLIAIVYGVSVMGMGGSLFLVIVRDAAGSSKKATGALAYSNLMCGIGGVCGLLSTGRSIQHLLRILSLNRFIRIVY